MAQQRNIKKVVLAYSGGLDTSVILKWLIETYHCEVITCTADLGQPEDLSGVEEKALKTGASKAYVVDLREEMARDFVFPMMRGAAATKTATCWAPLSRALHHQGPYRHRPQGRRRRHRARRHGQGQ